MTTLFTIRNFLLTLVSLICIPETHGQAAAKTYGNIVVEITKEKKNKIYTKVEIKSAFPGGDSVWVRSIQKQINQTMKPHKRLKKGKYYVPVSFIVDKDSNFHDIKPLSNIGFGLEEGI